MSLIAASGGTVVLVAVPVFLALAGLLLFAAARRRDSEAAIGALSRETRRRDQSGPAPAAIAAGSSPAARVLERRTREDWRRSDVAVATVEPRPVAYVPPDAETVGITRRAFFNRSIVSLMGLGLTGFGLSTVSFLWPTSSGGFGSKIKVGRLDEIREKIAEGDGFAYYPEGRMWITEYPSAALEKASGVYPPSVLAAMEVGLSVMYQKCPHLGCRVPQCLTSQWFECPCHGSQYNRAGEKKGGPAPRGLDRFATTVSGDTLTVDTGNILQGPPIGTNTTGQEAEGPHCIAGGGE